MVIQAAPGPKPGPNGPNRPSPVASIAKIASLKRFDNRDYALELLHDVAKAVGPLMHHFNFKLGMLCEMYPKNPQLLGLNVNHGQKILLRLRPPYAEHSFYPMSDLIGTMLHELAHNVHGPHDAKFYALLDELTSKYEARDFDASNYVCEENTLGRGYGLGQSTSSIRQKRLEALSKGKYKAELRKLGGAKVLPGQMREAMLRAAEQRIKDSKWCPLGEGIINVEELTAGPKLKERVEGGNVVQKSKMQQFKEVIDLTEEEPKEGDKDEHVDVIDVDACEQNPWDKLQPSLADDPSFGTGHFGLGNFRLDSGFGLNSSFGSGGSDLSPVIYRVSSSPGKTFIGDELQYPRRKMVADMDFEHIIQCNLIGKTKSVLPSTEVESTAGEKKHKKEKVKNKKKSGGSKKKLEVGEVSVDANAKIETSAPVDASIGSEPGLPASNSFPTESSDSLVKRSHKTGDKAPTQKKKKSKSKSKAKSKSQVESELTQRTKEVRAISFEELLQGSG